jgi:hypothetical protein
MVLLPTSDEIREKNEMNKAPPAPKFNALDYTKAITSTLALDGGSIASLFKGGRIGWLKYSQNMSAGELAKTIATLVIFTAVGNAKPTKSGAISFARSKGNDITPSFKEKLEQAVEKYNEKPRAEQISGLQKIRESSVSALTDLLENTTNKTDRVSIELELRDAKAKLVETGKIKQIEDLNVLDRSIQFRLENGNIVRDTPKELSNRVEDLNNEGGYMGKYKYKVENGKIVIDRPKASAEAEQKLSNTIDENVRQAQQLIEEGNRQEALAKEAREKAKAEDKAIDEDPAFDDEKGTPDGDKVIETKEGLTNEDRPNFGDNVEPAEPKTSSNVGTAASAAGTVGAAVAVVEKVVNSSGGEDNKPEFSGDAEDLLNNFEDNGDDVNLVEEVDKDTKVEDKVDDKVEDKGGGLIQAIIDVGGFLIGRRGKNRKKAVESTDLKITHKDFRKTLEEHKQSITHQQKLGNIDTHHAYSTPMIDRDLALFYTRECNLVYNPVEERGEEVGVDYIEEDSNYFLLRIRISFLGNRTVVAFRGTDNISGNVMADLYTKGWSNVKLGDYFDFVKDKDDLKVHTGFVESIKDIYSILNEKLQGRKDIEYTGHSYGSIVCIFAYLRLLELNDPPKHIYTFGSPRMFINDNNYSVSRFNNRIDVVRFFNIYDGISFLPIKENQSTSTAVLGTIGAGIGYSLGSLFSDKISKRMAGTMSAMGGVVSRQVSNYIHIGTGVLMFPNKGAKVRAEYSMEANHEDGFLDGDKSYIVIPKDIDIYRNLIDYNSYFTSSLSGLITTTMSGNKIYEQISQRIQKNKLQDLKQNIIQQIEDYSNIELVENVVDTLQSTEKELYSINPQIDNNLLGSLNKILRKLDETTLDIGIKDGVLDKNILKAVITRKREFLLNYPRIPYILEDLLKTDLDTRYLGEMNRNNWLRDLWKDTILKVRKVELETNDNGDSYYNKVSTLGAVSIGMYNIGFNFFKETKNILKFGTDHYLSNYEKNLKLLPTYIAENKNNNHSIKANVFTNEKKDDSRSKTDEVQKETKDESKKTEESNQNEPNEIQPTTDDIQNINDAEIVIDRTGRRRRRFIDNQSRRRRRTPLPRVEEEVEEEKEDTEEKEETKEEETKEETKEEINLTHIKDGKYIGNNNKIYTEYINKGNVYYREHQIKILGYYPYKNENELNKLVIF